MSSRKKRSGLVIMLMAMSGLITNRAAADSVALVFKCQQRDAAHRLFVIV